jgi:phosphoglycerate dehydrogenase-like enzyme
VEAAFNWRLSLTELELIHSMLPGLRVTAYQADAAEDQLTAWERRLDPDEVIPLVGAAKVLVALSVVPRDVFRLAAELRFVSSLEHGVNWLPFDLLQERDIQVANARGAHDRVVAEQAWALILASAKRLVDDFRAVGEARHQQNGSPGQLAVELYGETLAIIGLGGIGREIAIRGKAFGMHVIGVRRSASPSPDVDETFGLSGLNTVLPRARFVVLAAPLTPVTRRLVNETNLSLMRPDAFIVNVGRAGLVDERALNRALLEHRIAGYGTDVWWDYGHTHFGVPSKSGLHLLPNVIGTGDRSTNVAGQFEKTLRIGLENVQEFLNDRPLTRLVNLEAGY